MTVYAELFYETIPYCIYTGQEYSIPVRRTFFDIEKPDRNFVAMVCRIHRKENHMFYRRFIFLKKMEIVQNPFRRNYNEF